MFFFRHGFLGTGATTGNEQLDRPVNNVSNIYKILIEPN